MRLSRLLVIVAFALAAGCDSGGRGVDINMPALPPAPVSGEGQTITATLDSGGVTRGYRIRVPPSGSHAGPAPLVMNFHGLTSSAGEQEALTGMSAAADARGVFVVYPDGIDHHWNVTAYDSDADIRFVNDILDAVAVNYDIDPSRVYATGISNGGGMTNRVACSLSNRFAAIATVAGAYNGWRTCSPARPIPVLAFHGLDDSVAPYAGVGLGNVLPPVREWAAAWAVRNGCNSTPSTLLQTPTMTVELWSGCTGGEVTLYSLDNHGHSWPGSSYFPVQTSQEVNATDVTLTFFLQKRLP